MICGLLVLVPWQVLAQPATWPATPQAAEAARRSATLRWDYPQSTPPEQFVIQRSLDGAQTWSVVGQVPGRIGSDITWTDTNLPSSDVPPVAHYYVQAIVAGQTPGDSPMVAFTAGGHPRLAAGSVAVFRADSQEQDSPASNAIDSKADTIWHTRHINASPPPPHWIIFDLGEPPGDVPGRVWSIDGLAYLPRQDGSWRGTIGRYEVAVSMDAQTWSSPVAAGLWIWAIPVEQILRFPPTPGRYVRLRELREVQGNPWASAAEVGVFAAPTVGPDPGGGWSCQTTQPDAKTLDIHCVQQ
jgi:hypothetical protein